MLSDSDTKSIPKVPNSSSARSRWDTERANRSNSKEKHGPLPIGEINRGCPYGIQLLLDDQSRFRGFIRHPFTDRFLVLRE
jgi:hypothetical protein